MTSKKTASRKKAAPKEGKRKITYVALVIDRSGSMDSVRKQALNGLNEQIQTLRANAELGGETYVTLIQFNDRVEVLFDKLPASELKELTLDDYRPSGGTAMYDAVFAATQRIAATRQELNSTDDIGHLIVVISDGEENASKNVDANTISRITRELQATEKWTFTYMLSNVDLAKVQNQVSALRGNVTWYNSSAVGTSLGFAQTSNATANYLGTRSAGATFTNAFYSNPNITTNTTGNITLSNTSGAQVNLSVDKDGNLITNAIPVDPNQKP